MPCELILALDVPSMEAAAPLLRRLRGSVRWVKVGLQMFTAHGPDCVRAIAGDGFQVFLDLKLHDIPHTVARAVDSLAPLPIGMLTVHAAGGSEMLAAAARQARPDLLLLGVTVLTSMDAPALAATGVPVPPREQVLRLAKLAVGSGIGGLVCSPLEVGDLRSTLPPAVRLVTPGIRPAGGSSADDQKRVMTPAGAARAGASYIVVGRPILEAPDPAEAARLIAAELARPVSRTAAIFLAAGSGRRMRDTVADKVLASLSGRTVFAHSAAAFVTSGVADFYVVVYRDRPQMLALLASAPTPAVLVKGGRERQDSVMEGLSALPPDITHVFIHDCARPLIRPEQLVALHKAVRRTGAVVLAHRVADTIKERRATAKNGLPPARLRTLDRSRLWAMETPQVFDRALIARAYARVAARGERVTDDAAAVEKLGRKISLLENPHPNPKLTTPADFGYLEFLLAGHAAG